METLNIDEIPELSPTDVQQNASYDLMIRKPLIKDVYLSYKVGLGVLSNWYLAVSSLDTMTTRLDEFQKNIIEKVSTIAPEDYLETNRYITKADADNLRKKLLTEDVLKSFFPEYISEIQLSADLKEMEENSYRLVNSYIANMLTPTATIKSGVASKNILQYVGNNIVDALSTDGGGGGGEGREAVINQKKVVIWNEESSAKDYGMGGDVIARTGMIKGRTWRLLHGLYDDMPSNIDGFVETAMRRGALGIAVDVEGPFNNKNNLREIKNACDKFKAKLIGAPKVSLEPSGIYLDGNFKNSVIFCQEIFDAVLIWGYGCDGDAYNSWISRWTADGFTKQIGVFQDTFRYDKLKGYMGKIYWRDVAIHAKNGGYPFALFLPNYTSTEDFAELKNIFS